MMKVLLWMVILFVSILIHELGHALTSRKFTRVNPSIKLWGLGGLAYPNTNLTKRESFWVTWAGPLAGLAFFGVIVLFCCFVLGFKVGPDLAWKLLFPSTEIHPETAVVLYQMKETTWFILRQLFWVNFWWSLVNLLPVFPLDGGQIYASLESSQRKVFQVGVATGAIVAVAALMFLQSIFIAAMFGFLAYQNYQRLQQLTGRGGFR